MPRFVIQVPLALGVGWLLLAVACPPPSADSFACTDNSDCAIEVGYRCVEGRCARVGDGTGDERPADADDAVDGGGAGGDAGGADSDAGGPGAADGGPLLDASGPDAGADGGADLEDGGPLAPDGGPLDGGALDGGPPDGGALDGGLDGGGDEGDDRPLVVYAFLEGAGTTVFDRSLVGAPLDLTISTPSSTTWVGDGLLLTDPGTVIRSGVAASKVTSAVKASGEVSVEAWVTPTNPGGVGPDRIAGISGGSMSRNVHLLHGQNNGQPAPNLRFRVRTTGTDDNGTPEVVADDVVGTSLLHVVASWSSGTQTARVYVDGQLVVEEGPESDRDGDVSNWADDLELSVGDETDAADSERAFFGTVHHVSMYARALPGGEVLAHFEAGLACEDEDGDEYGFRCPNGPDCDDDDGLRHPGLDEVCDMKDNDCDGVVDEDDVCL